MVAAWSTFQQRPNPQDFLPSLTAIQTLEGPTKMPRGDWAERFRGGQSDFAFSGYFLHGD